MEGSAIFEEEILIEDDRTPSDMQRIQEILARLNLTQTSKTALQQANDGNSSSSDFIDDFDAQIDQV